MPGAPSSALLLVAMPLFLAFRLEHVQGDVHGLSVLRGRVHRYSRLDNWFER